MKNFASTKKRRQIKRRFSVVKLKKIKKNQPFTFGEWLSWDKKKPAIIKIKWLSWDKKKEGVSCYKKTDLSGVGEKVLTKRGKDPIFKIGLTALQGFYGKA